MSARPVITPDYVRDWATHAHGSPLYQRLCEVIAGDAELLAVINSIQNQPAPNMLLAGVQFLLMEQRDSELAGFYPSITADSRDPDGVDGVFRDFVLAHRDELVEIGRTRYTQTNECRRCAVLLPGVMSLPVSAFHLIDIGTSAGLNLAIDRYRYDYGSFHWGPASGVVLQCEARSGVFERHPLDVITRTGIDLNPIDPFDPDERRWLDALVWPEQHSRRDRLDRALDAMADVEFELIRGDVFDLLGETLAGLPDGDPAVIVNSFVLIQFDQAGRDRISAIVDEARSRRPVYRVSMEALIKRRKWSYLEVDLGDGLVEVGEAHPHGEWFELYA